jgi:Amt family ammonium transporter
MKDLLPLSPPSAYPVGRKLTFSQKLGRLRERMRDPEWRRYAKLVVGGKLLGMALLLAVIVCVNVLPSLLSSSAHGQMAATMPTTQAAMMPVMPGDLTDMTKNPAINPINTAWTLVAAFLVFGMQAGFTMLEAGFCRSRETVNVLVECVFDTCL